MILEIDEIELKKHWSDKVIQEFMKEKGLSRLETILYLWGYNNWSVGRQDLRDSGRPMYIAAAKGTAKLFKVKEQQ